MHRTRTVFMIPVLMTGALFLAALVAACGLGDETQVTPTAHSAALQLTVENTPLPGQSITPLPTPLPPPTGGQFGPVIGTDYTPEPLHTPLPATVSEQPCRVQVLVPEIALRSSPDTAAAAVGSAFERERLIVDQITRDAAQVMWARTAAGWLPLAQDGITTGRLATLRRCDILLGHTPDVGLLGLHVLNEVRRDEVLAFMRRMKDAGHPVGTIKGLNGAETMINEIEEFSPETVTVFRSIITADGFGDCPKDIRDLPDTASTAARWYAGFTPLWDTVNADYFEYMNECPATMEWIAQFSIEMMKLANQDQRCLLLFSFPGGNPDMNAFNDLLPAYRYAVENPCAPGRTHGIALHAYSLEDNELTSESDVWIALRHRIIHERLLMALPEAANLPVYITELGIGGGTHFPGCEMVIQDALQYIYQVEEDPYVKGVHLWNVGFGAQWYDIAPCLDNLGDALLAYYAR